MAQEAVDVSTEPAKGGEVRRPIFLLVWPPGTPGTHLSELSSYKYNNMNIYNENLILNMQLLHF